MAFATILLKDLCVTLLALADCYEEQGQDPEAEAVRWMVRTGRKPMSLDTGSSSWREESAATGASKACQLPSAVWNLLAEYQRVHERWKIYPSTTAALSALIAAFVAARRAGWEPQ